MLIIKHCHSDYCMWSMHAILVQKEIWVCMLALGCITGPAKSDTTREPDPKISCITLFENRPAACFTWRILYKSVLFRYSSELVNLVWNFMHLKSYGPAHHNEQYFSTVQIRLPKSNAESNGYKSSCHLDHKLFLQNVTLLYGKRHSFASASALVVLNDYIPMHPFPS